MDRLKAKIKDISEEDVEFLVSLITLSVVALALATLVIGALMTAPIVALPLVPLLGMAIVVLHKCIALPNTHSKKLTEDKEVTEFCKTLMTEINTNWNAEVVKTRELKQHGKYLLPNHFFKAESKASPVTNYTPPTEALGPL